MKKSISLIAFLCMAFFINAQSQTTSLESKTDEKETPDLFKKYDWLASHADFKDCKNISIQEYKTVNNSTIFIGITKDNKFKMYASDGALYCTNSNSLDCKEFYKLNATGDSWNCP